MNDRADAVAPGAERAFRLRIKRSDRGRPALLNSAVYQQAGRGIAIARPVCYADEREPTPVTQATNNPGKNTELAMSHPPNKRSSARRLIAGWCGLLLYVGAFSPLGASLAGVIGACDPDHQAHVQPTAGGFKVVLHHAQACPAHHHGLLARTLTLFAAPVRASQPDHVLQFGGSDTTARPQPLLVPAPASVAPPEFTLLETSPALLPETPPTRLSTHSPPPWGGQLLCVRSTVLLI